MSWKTFGPEQMFEVTDGPVPAREPAGPFRKPDAVGATGVIQFLRVAEFVSLRVERNHIDLYPCLEFG
jgi:hypothetical protein